MPCFHGETVRVLRPTASVDVDGDEARDWLWEDVPGVLVAPGPTADAPAQANPDRMSAALTLHFPKGFAESLRGCRVEVRGATYGVQGDPAPYSEEDTPGAWCMAVGVRRVDG